MTPEFRKICRPHGMWLERTLCFFFRSHRDYRLIDLDGFCFLCLQKVRKKKYEDSSYRR